MKIRAVRANNRRKALELATAKARFLYPFAKLDPRPSPGDPIVKAWVDKELASEAVTYVQASGREGTVNLSTSLSRCFRSSIARSSSSFEPRAREREASRPEPAQRAPPSLR